MSSPSHEELPLPDYDHLPAGGLRDRIRSLTVEEVRSLVDYENAHAQRVPVLEILHSRLEQLAAGSQPTSGSRYGERPEQSPDSPAGSPVTPGSSRKHPSPHGEPGMPGRPRRAE